MTFARTFNQITHELRTHSLYLTLPFGVRFWHLMLGFWRSYSEIESAKQQSFTDIHEELR